MKCETSETSETERCTKDSPGLSYAKQPFYRRWFSVPGSPETEALHRERATVHMSSHTGVESQRCKLQEILSHISGGLGFPTDWVSGCLLVSPVWLVHAIATIPLSIPSFLLLWIWVNFGVTGCQRKGILRNLSSACEIQVGELKECDSSEIY